jgi:hypothetical protein
MLKKKPHLELLDLIRVVEPQPAPDDEADDAQDNLDDEGHLGGHHGGKHEMKLVLGAVQDLGGDGIRAVGGGGEVDEVPQEVPVHHALRHDAGRTRVHDRLRREVMSLGGQDGGAHLGAGAILREALAPRVRKGGGRGGASLDGEVARVDLQGDVAAESLPHPHVGSALFTTLFCSQNTN